MEKIWDESEANQMRNNSSSKSEIANDFEFKGLEITLPTIPVKEIKDLEEANELFIHTHKWLKRARFFYSLRDYPLQYVNIMLELSELYRFLAFYEKTIDQQYDIQKKRYETLETLAALVKEIRPACYFSVNVEIIKEIMEVLVEMMNLNLKKLYNPKMGARLGEEDLRKRMFTVIDMSAKMNSICIENKDDGSDTELDSIVESGEDDKPVKEENKMAHNMEKLDEVRENGETKISGGNVTVNEESDRPKTDEDKIEVEEVVTDISDPNIMKEEISSK